MKKGILVLAFFLGLTAMIYAGGNKEPKTSEPVTIVWWNHQIAGASAGDILREYMKNFMEKYPNIKVEMDSSPHAEYEKKLPTAIAAGEAPDMFGMTYRLLYTYHINGSMAPIDSVALEEFGVKSIEELKKQWAPGTLESYQIGDLYYGLPWEFNIYGYAINAKHFREAGLDPEKDAPKYWDDVYRVGKKLVVKEGGRIKRQAISFTFNLATAWYMLEFEPIIRTLGGSVLNADQTECLINGEAGVKTMQELKRRFDEGIADKNIASTLDYHPGFPSGEFSMTIAGNWGPPRWVMDYPKLNNKIEDFKPIPYPTYPGKDTAISTTSWAWVVYSKSKHKSEAWKLANFATSFPSENIIKTGNIVPRAGWGETKGGQAYPYAAFWNDMLRYSQPLAKYSKFAPVADALKRVMEDILLSGKDIKQTLDQAKAEIDRILKE